MDGCVTNGAARSWGPSTARCCLWRLYGLLGAAAPDGGPGPLRVPAAYLAGDGEGRQDDSSWRRGWPPSSTTTSSSAPTGCATSRPGDRFSRTSDPRQETADWQAHLWRQLAEPEAGDHLARRLAMTLEKLQVAAIGKTPALPARITVFGVSSLPPIFLELLRAAARHLPVELYFASPTWHFWGDLASDREQSRLARRLRRRGSAPGGHYERGNSLLAALGGQGRDFFNLLQELDESGESWHERRIRRSG